MMDKNLVKENTAKEAVNILVKNGMKLGLGTGSTAIPAVRYIGELLNEGKLKKIIAVPTSFQTTIECEKLGIPLYSLNSREINGRLDLTIDGADEVDNESRLIKGGGGALLLEKLIAYASDTYAIVVDESKMVENLGTGFPVPVEVIPDARITVSMVLEKIGARVLLREAIRKAGPVITDRGNLLLDIQFTNKIDPAAMEKFINSIPGVVENGLFTGPWSLQNPSERILQPQIFTGYSDGRVERRN